MANPAGKMIDSLHPQQTNRLWIVSEVDHRWVTAVRRFAPELLPAPLVPSIVPAESAKVRTMLSGIDKAVVLWEVRRDSLAACCDGVAAVAVSSPRVLQLLATPGLSDRERLALSQFGCAMMIRHPEDLQGLSRLIHGYFAIACENLD